MKQDYLVYINQAHIIALIIPVNIKYLHSVIKAISVNP